MLRLTLDQIPSLRAQSEPLSDQIAGYVTSDSFKSHSNYTKPRDVSLNHLFSDESRTFAGSILKKTANKPVKNRFIPLGTGRPRAELYPWEALTVETTRTPTRRSDTPIEDLDALCLNSSPQRIGRHDIGYNLARALNYGHAAGSQPLVRFFTEHIELVHDPPYQNWNTCLTCGSTSAMEILLRMLCNRGDTILTERYTYPGTLEAAQLHGVRAWGIDMDSEGLVAENLEAVLREWDEGTRGRRPTVLYTIPSGQNPTGTTQSLERKEAVYKVAEKYDLVIIEDDPYYFLRMADTDAAEGGLDEEEDAAAAAASFLASLPPSFLSLDRSGRVIRLDSTSKILAPGLRAGWMTASAEVVEKFIAYIEVSTVAVSGPTQVLLWQLLESTWGHAGFFSWLQQLSGVYQSRLTALLDACEKYLPQDLCTWVPPKNGMFLWIALSLTKHPAFAEPCGKLREDVGMPTLALLIEERIFADAMRHGVQITKGSLFDSRQETDGVLHIRLTNAAAEEDEFDQAIQVLSKIIRSEFAVKEDGA